VNARRTDSVRGDSELLLVAGDSNTEEGKRQANVGVALMWLGGQTQLPLGLVAGLIDGELLGSSA
jgi:hypothetical protein